MPDTDMDINPESTPEEASEVAQRLLNGEVPSEPNELTQLSRSLQRAFEDQSADETVRERALISLYYILAQRSQAEEERSELCASLRSLLDTAAGRAAEFAEEKLRGRAHWIAIMLRQDSTTAEQLRTYVEKVALSGETSEYVWERIFAGVGNTPHASMIVPVPEAWLPDQTPRTYTQLLRRSYKEVEDAGATLHATRKRVRQLIEAYLAGEIRHTAIGNVLESLHGPLREYVLPAGDLLAVFSGANRFQRAEILKEATREAKREDLEIVSAYSEVFREVTADSSIADTHELRSVELTQISLELVRYRIGAAIDEDALAARVMQFLDSPLPETMKSSPALYTIYQVIGHAVNRLASTSTSFVGDLCRNETLMKRLLESEHPYLQLMGANIALIASRSGELPSEVKRIARTQYDANPETRNDFATGSDIKPEEFVLPEQTAVVAPATESTDKENESEADGFFNLEGLTGMLEICQLPHVAWRLREAVSWRADETATPVPSAPMMMSVQATAPSTDPEDPEASEERAQHRLVDEQRPGPGSFAWIAESFRTLSEIRTDEELERWRIREANRIEEDFKDRRQRGQRNAIRRVFEGGHLEEQPPLDRVIATISAMGRLEMEHEMQPVGNTNDERSIDYLAYYLPESYLPTDYKQGFGIYFNVPRILDYSRRIGAPVEPVVEVIAVHELFHAFVETTLGSDYGRKRSTDKWASDLEEAAANYYAHEHLHKLGSGGRIDQQVVEKIRRTLFMLAGDPEHGLDGYGEYPYLDSSACAAVPTMIAPVAGQRPVRPRNYTAESTLVLRSATLAASMRDQQWSLVLQGIEHPTIPMYLEFA